MKKINIAIIGGSGLVGQKIIQILIEEKMIENINLKLFVSENSAGNNICINNHKFKLYYLNDDIINEKFDIAFFSAGENISKKYAEIMAKNGTYVIDNSNAFRRNTDTPLVIPEINFKDISKNTHIISNPNCSTIQLAIIISQLLKINSIEKIILSTYQSVSGAGKNALKDLEEKTNKTIPETINNNLILKIGELNNNGFCEEENKIIFELNKILKTNIQIYASTVRVPIPFCHTESVYVKFNKKIDLSKIYNILNVAHIKIDKDITSPLEVTDSNLTHICRIRQPSENEILFFIIADNLRRGAAYNAVKIAELIINQLL